MHTERVRQCTRTIVICEFSRYSEISSKSGGNEENQLDATITVY
jgi:hypothetical protein